MENDLIRIIAEINIFEDHTALQLDVITDPSAWGYASMPSGRYALSDSVNFPFLLRIDKRNIALVQSPAFHPSVERYVLHLQEP